MCKVYAICNQKGGCSKTSVTLNLGIGLAMEGKRVALIDADPQGNLTISLGYPDPDELPITLATIMTNIIEEDEMPDNYGMLHHQEGIELIPANMELSGIEVSLANTMSREMILKEYIEMMCKNTFIKLAAEARAVVKVNRLSLVNTKIFEEYLETFRV